MMLRNYLTVLFRYSGFNICIMLGLMVLLGITQGIGLAMILPFLNIIGLDVSAVDSVYIRELTRIFSFLGLPLNLTTVVLAYIVVVSLYAAANRAKEIMAVRMVTGFTHHLRTSVYEHFCYSDWQVFLNTRDADIIHSMTHDIQRVAFATQQVVRLIVSGVLVTIYSLFCMTISVSMTSAAFLCGGLFLLLLYPFNRKATLFGTFFRSANNRMVEMINDHIGGMKVSKSYGLESYHKKELEAASQGICLQMEAFARINSATRFWYQSGTSIAIAVFITIGIQVFQVSATHLMVIVFLFSRILPGLSELQQCYQRIVNAIPSFRAVKEMEERFKVNRETPYPAVQSVSTVFTLDRAIDLTGVKFRYDSGSDWALTNLDITIPARKITAITGYSGAGKTTLADLLLGLLPPTEGKIFIDDTFLSKERCNVWRQKVGYVPQETYLFHESIRDNLKKASPLATEDQLWQALEKASAKTFVEGLPDRMDTVAGDRGIRLSGGERQRIALARALLRNPLLLILDEVTSALDNENERHIQSALTKLKQQLTIVVIAHRDSTIELADHVIRLRHEKISPFPNKDGYHKACYKMK